MALCRGRQLVVQWFRNSVLRAPRNCARHPGEEQLVDWVEQVPIRQAEEAVRLEERGLHE